MTDKDESRCLTCVRCGQKFRGYSYFRSHKAICENVPLPDDLVAEYFGEDMTLMDLANRYGVGDRWLRKRLKMSERYHDARKRKNAFRRERIKQAALEKSFIEVADRCHMCGAIFAHKDVRKDGDLCEMCQAMVSRGWSVERVKVVEYA